MKYYIVINCHTFMLKNKQDNLNITAFLVTMSHVTWFTLEN